MTIVKLIVLMMLVVAAWVTLDFFTCNDYVWMEDYGVQHNQLPQEADSMDLRMIGRAIILLASISGIWAIFRKKGYRDQYKE